MKIQDFSFGTKFRQETDFMDFYSSVQNIINLGRYQMRIVTSVPTWTGEGGEHLLYISGSVRRLYWYDDINSTWQYLEWNGSGLGQPAIAGIIALTGQTATIAATTIYTPSAAGLYRATVHHICTSAGSSGTLDTTISWTNTVGATNANPAPQINLNGAGNWGSGTVMFRSTAAVIQYATTVAGAGGNPQYALDISLERLS